MNLFTGFIVFQIIWWTVFMATLPFGVQTEKNPPIGFATSAPLKANIKKKMLITTGISAVLWFVIFVVLKFFYE